MGDEAIRISERTWRKLRDRKRGDESFDDVIERELEDDDPLAGFGAWSDTAIDDALDEIKRELDEDLEPDRWGYSTVASVPISSAVTSVRNGTDSIARPMHSSFRRLDSTNCTTGDTSRTRSDHHRGRSSLGRSPRVHGRTRSRSRPNPCRTGGTGAAHPTPGHDDRRFRSIARRPRRDVGRRVRSYRRSHGRESASHVRLMSESVIGTADDSLFSQGTRDNRMEIFERDRVSVR